MAPADLLLLGLTLVSGCMDAISYLGLGEVFPANMTGNTVLLGIDLSKSQGGAALRSAVALGSFLAGAAIIGATVRSHMSRRTFARVVTGEAAVAAALCGWWLSVGTAAPTGAARYGLIGLAATAMGVQSALVRRLGAPVATTYITGTWTALSSGLAAHVHGPTPAETESSDRGPRSHLLQAVVVLAYLGAAYGAALGYLRIGATAVVVPLGLLLLVVAAASTGLATPPGAR